MTLYTEAKEGSSEYKQEGLSITGACAQHSSILKMLESICLTAGSRTVPDIKAGVPGLSWRQQPKTRQE